MMFTESLIPLVFTLILVGHLVLACLTDFLYYRLPNKIFYSLVFLFVFYVFLTNQWDLWTHFILFFSVLGVGFFLFHLRILGGGDIKLFAACLLWVGWVDSFLYILVTPIIGAFVGVGYLCFKNPIGRATAASRRFIATTPLLNRGLQYFVPQPVEEHIIALHQKNMIPYGVAIIGAAFVVLAKRMF